MEDYNCSKHGLTRGVSNGRGQRRCAQCNSERVMERQREIKAMAVKLKGGCCSICSYDKSIAALEFHHTNPETKEENINKFTSWPKVEKELEKCILVCSNCHRELHSQKPS